MSSITRSFSFLQLSMCWPFLALFVTGCSTFGFGPFDTSPPEISGAVVASENLNPRRDGVSTSVVLHIYQLKTPTEFTQADFFSLYERGSSILGPDALIKELIVLPGSTTVLNALELSDKSTYIGVLAAFRDWKNASWSAVLETPANRRTILNIRLESSDLSVMKGKRSWLRKTRKDAEKNQEYL